MAVLVVVTHLGFGGGGSVTGSVDGLFGELDVRLVEDGARSRGVDGRLGHADRLFVRWEGTGGFDGGLVDADGFLEGGAMMGNVNSNTGYLDFVLVVRLETGTVFTLSNVDDRVVGTVSSVDLNARLGVCGLRSAVLFAIVILLTDAGTAVSFLFTSDADLFFAEASLGARKFGLGLERRVLTFPSGVLGGFDL
jgi:hypothetical protein